MLKAQNISRRFGATFALQDVTFTVRRGEILGLIGPNGAGKTTLLEILSGLLPADMGSVLWDDTLLHPARRKQVMFYLPEAVYPYPDRRAIDVLALFAHLFAQPNERLASIVGDLALSPILATRVAALSKGYRRRLLAIGLLAPQPLIMIDEPSRARLRQTRDIMGSRPSCRRSNSAARFISSACRAPLRPVRASFWRKVRGEGDLPELRRRAGSGQAGLQGGVPCAHLTQLGQSRLFAVLVAKEWRDILAGHALLLLLLSPLVGYSYIQAVTLYAEASRSAVSSPGRSGLSPLDGIFVLPGALYLANTSFFRSSPFAQSQ